MTYIVAITKKARMLPKKLEECQSCNKAMLAGVKQCNLNLFEDIKQILPIHLRCNAPGFNGVATSTGLAHCVWCYLRHLGLSANRHAKNCQG